MSPDLIETLPIHDGEVACDGLVKIRLVHARGFSLIGARCIGTRKSKMVSRRSFFLQLCSTSSMKLAMLSSAMSQAKHCG